MENISLIIPCLNYEKLIYQNLQKIVDKINLLKLNYEIIVINDGSTDNTINEILRFSKKDNKVRIINNVTNKGKSSSIISALKECKFDKVILIDCDIPYFDYFEQIVSKINENNDLVIVNRRLKESQMIKDHLNLYQKTRAKIGNFIGFVINFFLKINVEGTDTQAGLKGFKKIKNFESLKFHSKKYFFDLELIYYYTQKNKKILSIPIKYTPPKSSNIKIFSIKNFSIFYELIKVMIILKFNK